VVIGLSESQTNSSLNQFKSLTADSQTVLIELLQNDWQLLEASLLA